MKKITPNFESKCTGCAACQDVCPFGAITIRENSDGFFYPQIDDSKCKNCQLCHGVCPLNNEKVNNAMNPKCYAVWAKKDIRSKCSSGGVYGAIANKFIEKGQYISGAVWDGIDKVKHIVTNKRADLEKIIGSKYLQSNTTDCYKQIKRLLSNGKEVLFCGTPCQVAGLNSFIGYNNNLYTMDLVCHGVPSSKFFRKYLKNYPGIKSINFRDKTKFGWSTGINVEFENGNKFYKKHDVDTFYKAFLPLLVERKSCETCRYSSLPRQGDITIGDFWGIENYNKKFDDRNGTSVVLINSKKGAKLLKLYKKEFDLFKKVPMNIATIVNKNILHPFGPHFAKNRFFNEIDSVDDINRLVDMCINSHYDVGIVGPWYGLNFGSILTYYSLYKVISEFGYSPLMIDKPDSMWTSKYANHNSIGQKFIRQLCNVSNSVNDDYIKKLPNICDQFVVGSDVAWNYDICGKSSGQFFFLDFAADNSKKISYASSFGSDYSAPLREYLLSKHYLRKFDFISAREEEAVKICNDTFNVKAALVLDPVFLVEKNEFNKIACNSQVNLPNAFIGAYILDPDAVKNSMLSILVRECHLPVTIIPNPNNENDILKLNWKNKEDILYNANVQDFLSCIKKSNYFLANSFHATCFSIIFHKQFIAVTNKTKKDSCRFTNILKRLDLLDRLIFVEDFIINPKKFISLIDKPINYTEVDKKIRILSSSSKKWLKNALSSTKFSSKSIKINKI